MNIEEKRYQELKAALTTDVKTHLEHIRRYVQSNKAAVMVGAGVGENANHK